MGGLEVPGRFLIFNTETIPATAMSIPFGKLGAITAPYP
jgi:hypothetical protein